MKLFCFPFSGGSSSVYFSWFKNLDKNIELYPVELAGRNKRFSEPLIDSIEITIEDILLKNSQAVQSPYALFGHSLGCLIIYELLRVLLDRQFPAPQHVFLSGGAPPHFKEPTFIHTLSDQDFLKEIFKMGGLSQQFLDNKEIQKIFLPILRSDFKMFETYKVSKEQLIFPCPLTILAGNRDCTLSLDIAKEWAKYTEHSCEFIVYEGDHFFIKEHYNAITHLINKTLIDYVRPLRINGSSEADMV